MQLSETIKLYMTREQESLISATMTEYINTVNSLVSIDDLPKLNDSFVKCYETIVSITKKEYENTVKNVISDLDYSVDVDFARDKKRNS